MNTRHDRRPHALAVSLAGIALLGLAIAWWPSFDWIDALPAPRPLFQARAAVNADPQAHALRRHFEQGVMMLHMRQYEHAMVAFHRVLSIAPELPEAHVNMGFALSGLARWDTARDFFLSAIDIKPEQANAYYGLAVALDALADRAGAIGAMRTFLHRADPQDRFRRRAEAALWEWTGTLPAATPGIPAAH